MAIQTVLGEVPSGAIDSSNTGFTLAHTPIAGTLALYLWESRQYEGYGYTRSGANITMIAPPLTGDLLVADYQYDGDAAAVAASSYKAVYLTNVDDYAQDATVTITGVEDANYPKAYMLSLPVSKPSRFTGTTVQINIDLGSAMLIDICALIGHNLTSGSIVVLKGGSTSSCEDFTATLPYRSRTSYCNLPSGESYQYWQVIISDSGNSDGYVEVGRLLLGPATGLPKMYYGSTRQQLHKNFKIETEFGTKHIYRGYAVARLTFPFPNIIAAHRAIVIAMVNACEGDLHPLFIIPDTSGTDGYFGRWESDPIERREFYTTLSLDFTEESPGRSIAEA